MTDDLIPYNRFAKLARGAAPGRQWSSEALEAAHREVERYAIDLVAHLALPDPMRRHVRRISVEDVRASVDRAKDAYTLRLEQLMENHAARCEAFRTETRKRGPKATTGADA